MAREWLWGLLGARSVGCQCDDRRRGSGCIDFRVLTPFYRACLRAAAVTVGQVLRRARGHHEQLSSCSVPTNCRSFEFNSGCAFNSSDACMNCTNTPVGILLQCHGGSQQFLLYCFVRGVRAGTGCSASSSGGCTACAVLSPAT